MARLRRLVLGDDAQRVAEALPAAVVVRAQRDRKLALALEPLMADTLGDVAQRHPEKFADALRPIVGHAVRKAVAAAFAAVIQRVDQALQHTLTIRALRWRIEAARTGRPFAEIVLIHSLVYRVEEIFLVHRRTGLLLAHVAADPEASRDPDQVAAMLNVIEKFVRDAFREGQALTRFEVGDLQGRIEIGSEAAITAIVRGTPPEEVERALRDALERIELEHRDALLDSHVDPSGWGAAERVLATCLREQRRERRRSSVFWVLAAVLVLAFVVWIGRSVRHAREANRRLSAYAAVLRDQPGIVVTDATRDGDRFVLVGLRDPMAPDPATILAGRGLDPSRAALRFEPFYSLDGRLVEARARAALSPPGTVELVIDRGEVRVTGVAPREWLLRARLAGALLPGITSVDTSQAREREAIDDFAAAMQRVDRAQFLFALRSAELDPADRERLDAIAGDLATMLTNAPRVGVTVRIRIDAFADTTGSNEVNLRLSSARAEAVVAALARKGIARTLFDPRGEGAISDQPANARRAVLQVVLQGAP
jgi:outer membrane protein OmpA-like peptidoglycan-associated protein